MLEIKSKKLICKKSISNFDWENCVAFEGSRYFLSRNLSISKVHSWHARESTIVEFKLSRDLTSRFKIAPSGSSRAVYYGV
jgi:hypothetical protein